MTQVNYREIERKTYSDIINGLNVHDELKEKNSDELLGITQTDRFDYSVLCFNLTGELNIGTVIRSSILHGARKVIIFGRKKYDRRGTVGAHNYIDVDTVDGFCLNQFDFDIVKFNKVISDENFYPVFIEQGGEELQNYTWDTPNDKELLLIIGNETNGIPDEFLENQAVVSIPQRGVVRSFNVSSAMNIAAWDLRVKKGWF